MVFMTSRSPLPARLQPQQSRIRSISPKTEQMGTKLARLDTFTVWFAAMTHIGDLDQFGLSGRMKLLLSLILTGQFMAVLDASIVNVAIPTIRHDLKATGSDLQLIVAGYVIAYAVLRSIPYWPACTLAPGGC